MSHQVRNERIMMGTAKFHASANTPVLSGIPYCADGQFCCSTKVTRYFHAR